MPCYRLLITLIFTILESIEFQNGVVAAATVPLAILPIGPGHEGNDTILIPDQLTNISGEESVPNDADPLSETLHLNYGPGYEGDDILLTPEQKEMLKNRKGIWWSTGYWPAVNGFPLVRFTFNDSLVNQTAVRTAIAMWEANTCIKFLEVLPGYAGNHIYFQRHQTLCNSKLGMFGNTGQPINVAVWCEQVIGSLVHELGHAIGFVHEQSRSDRDDYVQINYANIDNTFVGNFDKYPDRNFSVPYDYTSLMHYNEKGFSINGRITIATRNPLYQGIIGQRKGFSHMDILLANRMYNCTLKYIANCSLVSDPCQNYGFMGRNCQCVCPPGTTGNNCQTIVTPYKDVKISNYSKIITNESVVTSALYPSASPGEKYTKWIQAPTCKLVRLTFNEFNAYQRINNNGFPECYWEGLEIRTSDMFDGSWYCGTEITPGQQFTSTGNQMILFFVSNIIPYGMAKWSANVTFVPDPACPSSTLASNTTITSTTTTKTTTKAPNTTTTSTTPTKTTTRAPNTTTTSTSTTKTTTRAPNTTTTSTSTTKTTTRAPNTTTTSTSTTKTTTRAPNTTTTSTYTTKTTTQALNTTTISTSTTKTTTRSPNTTTTSTTKTTTRAPNTTTTSSSTTKTTTRTPNTTNSSTTPMKTTTKALNTTTTSTSTTKTTSRAPNTTTTSTTPTKTTTKAPNTTTTSTSTTKTTTRALNTTTTSAITMKTTTKAPNTTNSSTTTKTTTKAPNVTSTSTTRVSTTRSTSKIRLESSDKEHRIWKIYSRTPQIPYRKAKKFNRVDPSLTYTGTLIRKGFATNNCLQSIDATIPGTVKTPNYPNKHNDDTVCQWTISASPGKQVRVSIEIKGVPCGVNFVTVNRRSQISPSHDDPNFVRNFCNDAKGQLPVPATEVISESDIMTVFYSGKKSDYGFQMTYEEVTTPASAKNTIKN